MSISHIRPQQLIAAYDGIAKQLSTRYWHLSLNDDREEFLDSPVKFTFRPRCWEWIVAKIFRYKPVHKRHETVLRRIDAYICNQETVILNLKVSAEERMGVMSAFVGMQIGRQHFFNRKFKYPRNYDHNILTNAFFKTVFEASQHELKTRPDAIAASEAKKNSEMKIRQDALAASEAKNNQERQEIEKTRKELTTFKTQLDASLEYTDTLIDNLADREKTLTKERSGLEATINIRVREILGAHHTPEYCKKEIQSAEADLNRKINETNEWMLSIGKKFQDKEDDLIHSGRYIERQKADLDVTQRAIDIAKASLVEDRKQFEAERAAAKKLSNEKAFILSQHPLTVAREKEVAQREIALEAQINSMRERRIAASAKTLAISRTFPVTPSAAIPAAWLALREAAEKGDGTDCTISCYREEMEAKRSAEVLSTSTIIHAHKHILSSHEYFAKLFNFTPDKGGRTKVDLKEHSEQVIAATLDWFYLKTIRTLPSPLHLLEIIQFADLIQEKDLQEYALSQLKQLVRKDFGLLLQTICVYFFERNRTEPMELLLLEELHVWFGSIKDGKLNKSAYTKIFDEYREDLQFILKTQKEHYAYQITLAACRLLTSSVEEELVASPAIIEGWKQKWAPALMLRSIGYLHSDRVDKLEMIMNSNLDLIEERFPRALCLQALCYTEARGKELNLSRGQGIAKALKLYRQAAEDGYLPAMNAIGYHSVKKKRGDIDEGLKWLLRAAELGCGRSQWLLAKHYDSEGYKDADKVKHWFEQSASNGYSRARI